MLTTVVMGLCSALAPSAVAQEAGAISGTVTESTGAVLPGVAVIFPIPADFAMRKLFKFGGKLTAEPALEVFNLTNANTVQGRVTILGSAYHRAASIMRGRMLRVGVNVKF